MRDFLKEFKDRIAAIDDGSIKINQPRYEKSIETQAPGPSIKVKLYNIHKRSLPVGIDKIIVLNVTKADAEWWINKKLKTKCYENAGDDSKTLIYYDVIPVDATPKERSVYYNMSPVTIEPIPGFNTPQRIN